MVVAELASVSLSPAIAKALSVLSYLSIIQFENETLYVCIITVTKMFGGDIKARIIVYIHNIIILTMTWSFHSLILYLLGSLSLPCKSLLRGIITICRRMKFTPVFVKITPDCPYIEYNTSLKENSLDGQND